MTILLAIVRQIGILGCAILALLAYYEGVPGLRDFPGMGSAPILREFTVGRVRIEADKAVAEATKTLVDRAELIAVREKADEFQRQIGIWRRKADEAEKQADSARIVADRAREDLEKRIAEDTDPDISRWRQRDLDRLRQ